MSFTYPGAKTPAQRDISLHLTQGQRLPPVGANGSGKTTLIKLLTRLYEPSDGGMLLDSRDLSNCDIQTLRRRIGVILQGFVSY